MCSEQDVLLPFVLFCFSDLTKLLVTKNYMNHKNHEMTLRLFMA